MPPGEFGYSEFHRSSRVLLAGLSALVFLTLAARTGLELVGGPGDIPPSILAGAAVEALLLVIGAVLLWRGAARPFARLDRDGVDLALSWHRVRIPWTELYGVEAPEPLRLVLRLSGRRSRTVWLTALDRDDRPAFLDALREGSRRS